MPDNAGNSHSIEVHSDGMNGFAKQVDTDVDICFRPDLEDVFSRFQLGTLFGVALPSDVIQNARQKHHETLDKSSQALASYANTSMTLAAGIRQVLANYGRADAAAAATTGAVQNALNGVIAKDVQARADAAQSQQATEYARQHGAPIPQTLTGDFELRRDGEG